MKWKLLQYIGVTACRIQVGGLGFGVQGVGLRDSDLRFRVQSVRLWEVGCKVRGLGLGCVVPP